MYIHIYINIYICTYIRVCMCVCVFVKIYICIYVYVYILHIQIYTYIYTHIYIYMYINAYTLSVHVLGLFPRYTGPIVQMCASLFACGAFRVSACGIRAYHARLVACTAQMFRQSVGLVVLLRLRQTPMRKIDIHLALFVL